MTFCSHHGEGVPSGKCELGPQSLAGPTAQTLNFRQQAPGASLRPFHPTAQPTQPAQLTLLPPRVGRGCWRPAQESVAENTSGLARGGAGEVAEAGMQGRPSSLGLGCWVLGARQRLRDTARQKPTVALCLHFASHTRACTHTLVQAGKHKPMYTPTGHTHTKHTAAIKRT